MAITREDIREFPGNRIIGYIETDTSTGDKTIRNMYNQVLGYYQASDNTTRNFYKQIVAKGDASSSLLFTQEKKTTY